MCGIVAIADLNQTEIRTSLPVLKEMTDLLAHRGPDDSGVRLGAWYGLGNRRLKIIDLESGHQPLSNEDGSVWITFNGEIYNHGELRQELIKGGHRFRTRSDTEVLVHGYEMWGKGVVHRLRGQFAFALVDETRNLMFVARDRLGIKPLYYTFVDGTLVLASEIKSILAHPGVAPQPNWSAVIRYFYFRYAMGKESLYSNILSLEAGHTLTLDKGQIEESCYWQIPIAPDKTDLGEAFYVDRVRQLLRESVRLRMISDVPLGAFLSGGLDSSIVAALMSAMSTSPVKTFTIGFEDDDYNEFSYARQVSKRHQTDHHEIVLSPLDYFEEIKRLIRFKDAPLSVPNEVPLHVMSRELRHHITVVLSGEGADELFGGYGRIFRSPFDYQRMKLMIQEPELLDGVVKETLSRSLERKYGRLDFPDPVTHFLSSYFYCTPEDLGVVMQSDFLAAAIKNDDPLKYIHAAFAQVNALDQSDQYLWIFQHLHLQGLLARVDMTTMATSVEARVPFVDHELVEFVTTIPFHYKIRWRSLLHQAMATIANADEISEHYDIPKYLLRRAFEDVLPSDVVTRKKVGFPVPLHRWFGGQYGAQAREVLLDSSLSKWGIFDRDGIERWLADIQHSEDTRKGIKLWMMMNLGIWLDAYF